jgi:hypothetical protein
MVVTAAFQPKLEVPLFPLLVCFSSVYFNLLLFIYKTFSFVYFIINKMFVLLL